MQNAALMSTPRRLCMFARTPLIPGVNDSEDDIRAVLAFIRETPLASSMKRDAPDEEEPQR